MDIPRNPYAAPASIVAEASTPAAHLVRWAVGLYVASWVSSLPVLVWLALQPKESEALKNPVLAGATFLVISVGTGLFTWYFSHRLLRHSWRARRWVILASLFPIVGLVWFTPWTALGTGDLLELPAAIIRIAAGVVLLLPAVSPWFADNGE